ncbi:hypothetical protein CAG70_05020 [Photobacterium halotolerans]|uniref:Uncharacterized protein n=1 Tax=Photobacterium halotolerans TaxID=265726 RepID=A0A7X4XW53_9GAMM|nr:hypothetical protein [Photobacterium halotolerans]NAW67677.1 hypothetical protein [Photobacterium halotolerans]NAX46357.1 hypothetical protein [Photobacterium halotolerans]
MILRISWLGIVLLSGPAAALDIHTENRRDNGEPYCAIQLSSQGQVLETQLWGTWCGGVQTEAVYRDSEELQQLTVVHDRGKYSTRYYINTAGPLAIAAQVSFTRHSFLPDIRMLEQQVWQPLTVELDRIRSSVDVNLLSTLYNLPLDISRYSPAQLFDEQNFSLLNRIGHVTNAGCLDGETYVYLCEIGRERVASACLREQDQTLTYRFSKAGMQELTMAKTLTSLGAIDLSFQRGHYKYQIDSQAHQLRVSLQSQLLFEATCR